MLSAEQKARLNPEQLSVAEKWDRERGAQEEAIEAMTKASEFQNIEAYQKAVEKFLDACDTSGFCEHERSIWSSCAACEEIEQLLNPEFYNADGERLPEEVIEELISKKK